MSDIKKEMTEKHWLKKFNWAGLSVTKLAKHFNTTEANVRVVLAEIVRENSKIY